MCILRKVFRTHELRIHTENITVIHALQKFEGECFRFIRRIQKEVKKNSNYIIVKYLDTGNQCLEIPLISGHFWYL